MKRIHILFALFLVPMIGNSQVFSNLDFENTCDTSETGLCSWDLSWGGPNACKPEKLNGNQWLLISGDRETAVGFAEQTGMLASHEAQLFEVTARISSENVNGKGAGLNVGVYDSAGNLLFTKDMGYGGGWIKGTTGWKEYSVKGICATEATKIKVGAILYGKGKARFDDYRVILSPLRGRTSSDLATRYVSAACDSIAKHSLRRDSIDIDALKSTALQIAGPATQYSDCHLAIEYLLMSLGDHHSFFMSPRDVAAWQNDSSASSNIRYATSKVINDCGYITVPPFHGGNSKLMSAYADSIQAALKKLDNAEVKGWIVDLRANTGGNMAPMIAGLGPLFDSDTLGSLVDVSGNKETWRYKNGAHMWDNEIEMRATNPVTLSKRRHIAVLIGGQTGSSGEIVVISFIGNANTRFFGQPTWGLTTGNGSFDLTDRARMMMAATVMADRTGKLYQGSIHPDETIEASKPGENDATVERAIEWLLNNR